MKLATEAEWLCEAAPNVHRLLALRREILADMAVRGDAELAGNEQGPARFLDLRGVGID